MQVPNTPHNGRGAPTYTDLNSLSAEYTLPAGRAASLAQCPGSWNRTIDHVPQCRFARGDVGASYKGSFTSEFGAVAMPSFESLSATLVPKHWSLHSPPMSQRNWPADGAVASYFGLKARGKLNQTGAGSLKTACYQSMLAQALEIKSRVELIRSSNSFGALTWQLNEVFPTGSWGSLEYGAVSYPGQVVGGRWRLLHYFLRREIWVDTLATCGVDGYCFVRSDSLEAQNCSVQVGVLNFAKGSRTVVMTKSGVSLGVGAGQLERFCFGTGGSVRHGCTPLQNILTAAGHGACWNTTTGRVGCALEVSTRVIGSGRSYENMLLLETPQHLALPAASVSLEIAAAPAAPAAQAVGNHPGRVIVANITLKSTATALFVTLTTRAYGRFSDNGFTLVRGEERKIQFVQIGSGSIAKTVATLRSTIRVEHLHAATHPETDPSPDPSAKEDDARPSVRPSASNDTDTSTNTSRSRVVGGRLEVNGQQYFPLGVYVHSLSSDQWDHLARAGYNTVLTYTNGNGKVLYNRSGFSTTMAFLDAAAARGIMVLLSLKDFYNTTGKPDVDFDDLVVQTVQHFKGHPALLGWYLNDEYHVDMLPILRQRFQLVTRIDPGHISYSVENTGSAHVLKQYIGTSSMFGVDPYPWLNSTATTNLSAEADEITGLQAAFATNSSTTICTVAQAFSWKEASCNRCPKEPHECAKCHATFPPDPVLRAMSVLQGVLGSGGIMHYAFYAVGAVPEKEHLRRLTVMANITRELRTLADELFLPGWGSRITVDTGTVRGSAFAALRCRACKYVHNTDLYHLDASAEVTLCMLSNTQWHNTNTVFGLNQGLLQVFVDHTHSRTIVLCTMPPIGAQQ